MSLWTDIGRGVRVANYRAKHFWLGSLAWLGLFAFPILPGLLIGSAFRELQRHGSTGRFYLFAAALVVSQAIFTVGHIYGATIYARGYEAGLGLLQINMVHAQVVSGGPEAGPRTRAPSEAVSRFRDDPRDVMLFVDTLVDIAGAGIFGAVAIAVMFRINALATIVGILPMIALTFLNHWAGHRSRKARAVARQSTSEVTGFLGAALGAATTVKVFGAGPAVLRRLDQLGDDRAKANVKDQVITESMFTVTDTVADFSLGLSLLVAALGARAGRLDAGGVALFASYLGNLVWLPRRLAMLFVGRRRFEVSAGRIEKLLPDRTSTVDPLTTHRMAPILGGGPVAQPTIAVRRRLNRVELVGLTNVERGLNGVNLVVERGQIAIVTGPVGSGKSSLLQAVLGLIAVEAGQVRWNDEEVLDRAAFFIPPHCAFVPQTPTLFAESLAENLCLGEEISDDTLVASLRQSAFDDDVAGFPEGLATRIGSRGIRLSGGQLQRAAAARAFVKHTELVVLDDLTSALDVETELLLWERLRANGVTVLAASTRPAALAQADVILDLGRLAQPAVDNEPVAEPQQSRKF
jgi:ATP-binding cassette, subfamily B, bacterial